MTDTINFGGRTFAKKPLAPSSNVPGIGGLSYMKPNGVQTHITDSYVSTPPALWIIDETGAIWTLGMESEISRGEFAFDVLRNAVKVGEKANRIEMRGNRISIFGPEGRKNWTGRSFV